MALPNPGMEIAPERTALVITDPQNDFLSPDGVTWGVVGESVTANNTVENIGSLLKASKEQGIQVFISPHYYYPTDHGWQFEGALERLMHDLSKPKGSPLWTQATSRLTKRGTRSPH